MKSEEVARLAGVSRSTVSRVINNYSNVPDETREKVMKVIQEHNYVPNTSARILAGKGTNTIGLFIFYVHGDMQGHIYGNSYFGPFVNAVVDRCNSNGYSVLIHTLYTVGDCKRIPTAFAEKRIDGAIVIGTEKDEAINQLIADASCPLVLADYNPKTVTRLAAPHARLLTVNSDDDGGIARCVDYLVELGHQDIGLITGRMNTWSAERRLRGYKKRMKQRGLAQNPKWVLAGDFSRPRTEEAVRELLSTGSIPTALIASNDDMALVAIETLREAGLNVPTDVSVIGYDDGLAAPLVRPALTTVRVPFFEMAGKAVEGLIGMLEENLPCVQTVTLPVELIMRESCGGKLEKPNDVEEVSS